MLRTGCGAQPPGGLRRPPGRRGSSPCGRRARPRRHGGGATEPEGVDRTVHVLKDLSPRAPRGAGQGEAEPERGRQQAPEVGGGKTGDALDGGRGGTGRTAGEGGTGGGAAEEARERGRRRGAGEAAGGSGRPGAARLHQEGVAEALRTRGRRRHPPGRGEDAEQIRPCPPQSRWRPNARRRRWPTSSLRRWWGARWRSSSGEQARERRG